LKGERKDGERWKTSIDAARDDARARTIQLIENGAVAAKTIINKTSAEVPGSAADIFNASWPAVIAVGLR
jgi:hypothetical protein